MAVLLADRVQETSTTPGGTGALTLTGSPVPGYTSFSNGIGTGNSLYYTIYDAVTYAWEVGIGSWSANVLTRTSVLSNSLNTTAFISFVNGNTLNVWVDYPASSAVAQTDIGSAPNQIPLNQYLGNMAYQDMAGVNITGGTATLAGVTLGTALTTANGGTGLTSFTSGGLVYASSTSALATGSILTLTSNALKATNAQSNQLNLTTSSTGNTQNIQILNGSNYGYGIVGVVSGTGALGGDVFGLGYSSNSNSTFTPTLVWNSIGNVGLTTNPSTAWSSVKALEISGMVLSASATTNYIGQNAYFSVAGQYTYKATATAALYTQSAGTHAWSYAASGTAATTISFTQAMQIGATGGLSIGNTVDKGAGALNLSGLMFPQQATTAAAPAYVKGAIYFDTTLNKLRVGGATAWETITSV